MSDAKQVAERWVHALAEKDVAALDTLMTPEVGLREYGPEITRVLRGLDRVRPHLEADLSTTADTRIERLSVVGNGERAGVEYRVQRTLDERYTEEMRSAFLQVTDGRIHTLDIYRTAPMPSAHREGWMASADITEEEVGRVFDEGPYFFDIREWIPPHTDYTAQMRVVWGGTGDAHPGSNFVYGFRYPADEADERIEALIERFRERDIGFTWYLSPYDEPPDLAERLERHGLILAGDQWQMARIGLEPTEIRTNERVTIELLDGTDEDAVDDMLRITARSFNWTAEQLAERRAGTLERLRDPRVKDRELLFLARLDGQAIGYAKLFLEGGIAYLGGAAVEPEARNQRIYSTLLAKRLRVAHERGYHVAAIHSEPMSRRVVSKYGFRPYGRTMKYGWMPVPDHNVIRGLVAQE
jgi:predicted N-acetyltransferase YhbS